MVNFGFSIYPENHSVQKTEQYMDLLKKYGASRIFMSLLQLETDDTSIFDKYQEIIAYANQLDLKVIADISPAFVKQAGWDQDLIEKAHQFGLKGLRLDEALDIDAIVDLTKNPYGIKIELNMSTDATLLNKLIEAGAKLENVIACHNFYPHEFTGLSVAHFEKMNQLFKEVGIETAAFVNARTATEGPWPLSEGLCTVEDHRHLPIELQAALLIATEHIDNILIANQFITEEELQKLTQRINEEVMVLPVKPFLKLTETERQIIEELHVYRGDISDYVIRSTMTRVKFADQSVAPRDQVKIVQRGSIIIDNDLYTRYKGELQIALKVFEVSDKANVVAEILPEAVTLLNYLKPWQAFKLEIVE
ncbi:DUF871 domain-containing protein [Globicatella sanguinis]|uniref:DUF871 domain-containing protein n=1 Tax=Globicatella sanguinis TaxID=13076 RepID=UPI002543A8D7|nr:MupG family TIM beta-alpha barrel fold protein [Globicatella sanguinis]MDK7630386.1 MupG family TIM beta-alpha barrel fold protein [Globicatella sanguinis]WIK66304.1 MupG family TIM beta-alpha barrel fold protein [Globicatella sanguinis]WKT55709.1 MupG family TIM beta-alpha barrel fold protein [Globicatella sanguinis]